MPIALLKPCYSHRHGPKASMRTGSQALQPAPLQAKLSLQICSKGEDFPE